MQELQIGVSGINSYLNQKRFRQAPAYKNRHNIKNGFIRNYAHQSVKNLKPKPYHAVKWNEKR